MKAAKFRFYPTLAQRKQLAVEFIVRRKVWNWALETRRTAYREDKTNLNAVALSRLLTLERRQIPFLKKGSATVSTYTLRDLDSAFDKFFKKQAKFPKRKKFGTVNSAQYQIDKRKQHFRDGELLKLPKLGVCKIRWSRSIPGIPNSATVSHTPDGKWYISLQYDCDDPISPPEPVSPVVGIDLGLTTLVTLSTGEKINGLNPFKNTRRKLAIAQRRLSKAQRGGSTRRKRKQRVASIHRKISNQRKDFQHKLSTSIVTRHGAIGIEDLNVRGMMANGKLSRAVADCGFYELRRQISYKAKWYGRTVVEYPRFDRSTGVCPECGIVGEKLPLSKREWTCECGVTHDRDIAAAQVIALYTAGKAGINDSGLAHTPDNSGFARDDMGRIEGVKTQLTSANGLAQRTPRFQGARL